MWSLIGVALSWLLGMFKPSTRKDDIALGRAQEQVAERDADMAAVTRANAAARKASINTGAVDANDLDSRR